jgi:hypothetical protein
MNKKAITRVLLVTILIITAIVIGSHYLPHDSKEKKIRYMENPIIQSCSNDANLKLNLRFLTNEIPLESYSVISSNKDVIPKIEDISELKRDDGNTIFTFFLNIIVPEGISKFDLKFEINGKDYSVKDIENNNFNVPNEKSSKEFVVYSPYVNKGEIQEFNNSIIFKEKDITGADFGILGEKVLEKKILNKNTIELISENNKPAIVGYYYEKNNQKVCIANAYHTEYLENEENK